MVATQSAAAARLRLLEQARARTNIDFSQRARSSPLDARRDDQQLGAANPANQIAPPSGVCGTNGHVPSMSPRCPLSQQNHIAVIAVGHARMIAKPAVCGFELLGGPYSQQSFEILVTDPSSAVCRSTASGLLARESDSFTRGQSCLPNCACWVVPSSLAGY
jgi:hypothetical protein